jgi:hypothetical protein
MRIDRAKGTDLFVHSDQILAEFLKAMELGNLLLRLTQRSGMGKRLRHALATHPSGKTELRVMTSVIRFGAMAGRLTTAANHSRD